jgi:hypothetical protein
VASFLLLSWAPLARGSTEDCLHTKDGVPIKVILKADTAICDQPDKSGSGKPGLVFDWFYALPTEKGNQEKLKNDFYHVAQGTGWSDAVGWVHKDAVVEWNHREAISFRSDPSRDRVLFYSSYEDLNKYVLETKNAKNPQPLSREPEDLGSGFFVMPVLDVKSIGSGGTEKEVYQVAYLHGDGTPRPSSSGGSASSSEQSGTITDKDIQEKFTLDVVFVVDTTVSMEPWIKGVKETMKKVTTTLADHPKLKGRIRFGLVAYRDKMMTESADRQMEYLTKICCTLNEGKDPQAFLQRVDNVHDAAVGSEDWPEDVIAGMKVALTEMDWNPIAARHLILIGDASAQDSMEDPKAPNASRFAYKNYYKQTLDYITSLAQPAGETTEGAKKVVTIHALRIKGEDAADWDKCERDFKKLAAGRDWVGMYRVYDQGAVEPFIRDLLAQLERPIDPLNWVVNPGQTSNLKDPAKREEAASLLHAPILRHVQSGPGPVQTSGFASGWACKTDVRDNFQLESHVLVTRGRMETFLTALDSIVQILQKTREPGAGDISKCLAGLQIVATQVLYGEPVDRDTPLTGILSWILGAPIPTDIFKMSISRLKSMTQKEFDDWVEKVQATQHIIRASLDDRGRWRSVGTSTSEADKHAFIKVTDMP